jgi:uncharacterized membrane protein
MEAPTPNTERLETFSDGIFAVAATLLVLNLRAPPAATSRNTSPRSGPTTRPTS